MTQTTQKPAIPEALASIVFAEMLISTTSQQKLWEAFKDFSAILEATPQELALVLGPNSRTFKAWQSRLEKWPVEKLEKRLAEYQNLGIEIITIEDADYPQILKETHEPPKVLFAKGNLELLNAFENTLSVVGTRKASPYGKTVCQELLKGLAPYNPIIISGMAEGIDTEAHQTALENNFKTIAVFGTGMDKIYPTTNRKLATQILKQNGLLLTEYPLGVRGDQHTFPSRNRIVAGLAQGTLVIEAPEKSGAMITARLAAEENRTVMAVCGNVFNTNLTGCHKLIKQGATLITNSQDIIEALNWDTQSQQQIPLKISNTPKEQPQVDLSKLPTEQQTVLKALSIYPTQLETILNQLPEMPTHQVQQQLLMLELQGVISCLPGNHYQINS